jgi:hypothetical protein
VTTLRRRNDRFVVAYRALGPFSNTRSGSSPSLLTVS